MVTWCSAFKCKSKQAKGNGLSFHRCPINPEMRKKWIVAANWDRNPSHYTFLCSKHFKKDDYLKRFGPPRLKPDVVPSIFDFPQQLQKKNKERTIRTIRSITPRPEKHSHKINNPVNNGSQRASQTNVVMVIPEIISKEINLSRLMGKPSTSASRICSCHFQQGEDTTITKHETLSEDRIKNPKKEEGIVLIQPSPVKNRCNRCNNRLDLKKDFDPNVSEIPSTRKKRISKRKPNATPVRTSPRIAGSRDLQHQNNLKSAIFTTTKWSYSCIDNNDKLVSFYSGLPNNQEFEALYTLLEGMNVNYYYDYNDKIVSKKDQLFMCLMKLRQNIPRNELAQRFRVSKAVVSNIIVTWCYALHQILFKQLMATPYENRKCLSSSRIVFDCVEIATIGLQDSMPIQESTYSRYRNICKALIGVSPNGTVTYVSELYPGSVSDVKVVTHSRILEQMKPGDLILADNGFGLDEILPPGVDLNIPRLSTSQFTSHQLQETRDIAQVRIHVEKAIQRMKIYRILNNIPQSLLQHVTVIVQLVGALTNLQINPFIKAGV